VSSVRTSAQCIMLFDVADQTRRALRENTRRLTGLSFKEIRNDNRSDVSATIKRYKLTPAKQESQ